MASSTKGLNRKAVLVILFVAAAFIVLSVIRMTSKAEEGRSLHFANTQEEVSKLLGSDESQGKEEKLTEDLGDCDLDRKFLPEGSRPLLLLLSFPGSGNTWVRYLIERSTGIYSGSLYNDVGTGNNDSSVWLKSNPCSKETLVVKSHGWENFNEIKSDGKTCKVDGVVLIIRNPYGAILAEFNRRKKGKTGTASVSQFLSNEWKKFSEQNSGKWLKTNKKGLEIPNKVVVFYEDLVNNTEYELRRILDFLEVSQNDRRIACLLRDTAGKFKRVHKKLEINPFTAEINKTIDANIVSLRKILQTNNDIELPPYESVNILT